MTPDSLRHPRNWPLASRALVAVLAARIVVTWAPQWTLRCLRAGRHAPEGRGADGIARIASAVWTIAGRHRNSACLPRAVAITALARRAGIPADLVIGVRREGTGLDAHAWVESNGTPVPPQNVEPFVRIWESR